MLTVVTSVAKHTDSRCASETGMGVSRGDTYDAQAACIADRTCQLSVAHPLHATLHHGHWKAVKSVEFYLNVMRLARLY